MIPIMSFQDRALTGPVMKTTQFDLAFSKRIRELVAEHQIVYDSEMLIVDDKTADAIFEAAVKLLADVGLYHLDTQRVIRLEEQEIRQMAAEYRENPPAPVFGTGADQITVRARTYDDPTPPILAAGIAGLIDQEWFTAYVQSHVQEPTNRALGIAGGITSVNGRVPKAGTLSEMYCAQWECEQLREVLRRVGRPGMHLGLLCTASTAGAVMACMREGLRDATNTQIGIHIIPEQKLDWTRLILAKFCQDRGIVPWTSCSSIMGAICRGPADTAVALIANVLGQLSYGHGSMVSLFTNHIEGTWADAETIWATSGACRAVERNLRIPTACVCTGSHEQEGTRTMMIQAAATTIGHTASGFAYAWVAGANGIEARMLGEIMNGVAGMPRDKANALIHAVLEVAAAEKALGEPIRRFPELFDLQKVTPLPYFVANFENAKEQLAKAGVPF